MSALAFFPSLSLYFTSLSLSLTLSLLSSMFSVIGGAEFKLSESQGGCSNAIKKCQFLNAAETVNILYFYFLANIEKNKLGRCGRCFYARQCLDPNYITLNLDFNLASKLCSSRWAVSGFAPTFSKTFERNGSKDILYVV